MVPGVHISEKPYRLLSDSTALGEVCVFPCTDMLQCCQFVSHPNRTHMCIPPTLLSACIFPTYLITVLPSVSLVANAASIAITESTTWGTRTSCKEEGLSSWWCGWKQAVMQSGATDQPGWIGRTVVNRMPPCHGSFELVIKQRQTQLEHATKKFWEPKHVCRIFADWHWTTKGHRFALKCYSGTQGATSGKWTLRFVCTGGGTYTAIHHYCVGREKEHVTAKCCWPLPPPHTLVTLIMLLYCMCSVIKYVLTH